ncbi:MAG TPA: glutamate 5-kinase, partial [Cutibacterium acnes]|nr:glutamate 5-kinase [Cutibacterium acnes]
MCGAATLVVKVGSSSLTLPGGGIDVRRVDDLVDALSEVIAVGRRVVLVSSGAIATGFPAMGITHRPRTLAGKQAAASVGQGILLAHYASRFASHGLRVGQVLLTVNDLVRPTSYRNAWSTLDTLLGLGVVPIVNENDTVATGEIRFGDNDRLAALVAELV